MFLAHIIVKVRNEAGIKISGATDLLSWVSHTHMHAHHWFSLCVSVFYLATACGLCLFGIDSGFQRLIICTTQ